MKKFVSIILIAALFITAALNFTAVVGADGVPTLTVVNGQTVDAGDTFTVSVEMSNNPGLWATKIFLYFDPELVCESVEAGEIFTAGQMTVANDLNRPAATNPLARAVFDGRGIAPQDYNSACLFFSNDSATENRTGNGVLATFTMRAPSEPGTYFIGIVDSYGDVINCLDEDITFAYVNSSIVVEESVHVVRGDVNGDGVVNMLDVRSLKRYLAGAVPTEIIVALNSDMNDDGVVNVQDLKALKQVLAG